LTQMLISLLGLVITMDLGTTTTKIMIQLPQPGQVNLATLPRLRPLPTSVLGDGLRWMMNHHFPRLLRNILQLRTLLVRVQLHPLPSTLRNPRPLRKR